MVKMGSGLTHGPSVPSAKGERLVVLHAMSRDGLVPNVGRVMRTAGKSRDYHGEMNADYFEKWIDDLIPNLPEKALVIFDNASYHSRRSDDIPTKSSRKLEVEAWLLENGIDFDPGMLKSEMIKLVNKHKAKHMKYCVDEKLMAAGVKILRLPPYHCMLNPIEHVWAAFKHAVGRRNTADATVAGAKDVQQLANDVFAAMEPAYFSKVADHAIKTAEYFWSNVDHLVDIVCERLEIDLNSDCDTSDDDSSNDEYE